MNSQTSPSLFASVQRLFADERRRQATDRDLLQAFAQRGESDAFAELLRRHGPMVLRLALHLLHHRQDAEDVFQATFLTLARQTRSLRRASSVAAWLHRVAWRLAMRSRTASKRRAVGVRRLIEGRRSPEADEISLRESQELLHQELAALPEKLRLPLVLCYLQERTRDEAARQLGWSLGTFKRRLEQGRKLLHARLSRRGVTLPALLSATLLASVAVPASLAESTVRLATSTAAGSASLPASVAMLLAEMSSSVKVKVIWGWVLILGACAGVGAWAYQEQGGEPAAPQALSSPPATAKGDEWPRPGVDLFGDPLPAGAIARLGTVRLRHGDYLHSIRFAPDGKTIISTGGDGVRVWDAATGKPVRHFGRGVLPRFSTLSSDGRRIALLRYHAGIGGPVEVWDVTTGKLLNKMGNRHYSAVRFSPDGKQLAGLSSDFRLPGVDIEWNLDLWDAETGRTIRTQTGTKEFVPDMAFSADGKTLLLAGPDNAISVRSTADGKETRRFRDLPAGVNSFRFSPQGDRIAITEFWQTAFPGGGYSWGAGTRVFLLDARTGAELRRWSVEPEFERNGVLRNGWWSLAFSPDGRRLAACQRDGPIRVWDTDSGTEKRLLPDGRMHSGGVAFSSDGKTLAVGDGGRMIRLIDAQTGADRLPVQGHRGRVTNLALSRDGRAAFTAVEEGVIHRWDVRTGREHEWHLDPKARVEDLLLSSDGRTLLMQTNTERQQSWECWDIDSRVRRWRQEDPGGSWCRMALSPDGATLATAGGDATVLKLIKTSTGECLHDLPAKTPIWSMAFSPDASTVFTLTGRWTVRRWETSSGRPLPDLTLPAASNVPYQAPNARGAGESAVLSPDGRLAAYAYDDKFLLLFDVFGQREIHHFADLAGPVAMMAFAPDDRTFVWAERSGVLHWLELASGGERRTLPGHAGSVSQLVFGNDGKHLVSSSDDATALVWELIGQKSTKLSAEQRDASWSALADKDAAKAYRALCSLIVAPADALALLRSHLKPIEGVDEKRIARLIADLDADAFAVRDKATEELRKLGELAEPAYRQVLAARPSLETNRRLQGLLDEVTQYHWQPSSEVLRQLRAIEVLERIGTPEAQRLLETLARGANGARQTQDARAAVRRLQSARPALPSEKRR